MPCKPICRCKISRRFSTRFVGAILFYTRFSGYFWNVNLLSVVLFILLFCSVINRASPPVGDSESSNSVGKDPKEGGKGIVEKPQFILHMFILMICFLISILYLYL